MFETQSHTLKPRGTTKSRAVPLLILIALVLVGCGPRRAILTGGGQAITAELPTNLKPVVEGAIEQTRYTLSYDPAYVKLSYPGGDVPQDRGVCSDVVVRAFRKGAVDLQKEVHEDMSRNFSAYPHVWGNKKPDSNIDHRRVPNLMTYFKRQGKSVAITKTAGDYLPGDVVAWDLGNGLLHIGIVSNLKLNQQDAFFIVHNIGAGARIEDVLFSWKIIGHYRYFQ